ncbi:MAG: methyltransferase domain-containing protein [Pseudomonadota bacterium]
MMAALASSRPTVATYERLATGYDRTHSLWLRHAGGEAQSALEAATRVALRPGMRLLDAGCGTGAFVRRLLHQTGNAIDVTVLDPSRAMLARCGDIRARQILGRLETLPLPDCSFDIVTCAWALETTADPERAIAEMRRVVKQGGILCLAFCTDRPAGGVAPWLLRQAIERGKTGRFLPSESVELAVARNAEFATCWLPCRGPAAALFARKR